MQLGGLLGELVVFGNMTGIFRVNREFSVYYYIFGKKVYEVGVELEIRNGRVMDGTCELFHIKSDFAARHGEVVEV